MTFPACVSPHPIDPRPVPMRRWMGGERLVCERPQNAVAPIVLEVTPDIPLVERAREVAAFVRDVDADELAMVQRGRIRLGRARWLAMWIVHRETEWPRMRIAEMLGYAGGAFNAGRYLAAIEADIEAEPAFAAVAFDAQRMVQGLPPLHGTAEVLA